MAYRFSSEEIAEMKDNILTHCNNEQCPDEHGNKSAWRLRLVLEGLYMCCQCSQRERAKRRRRLALYESLTRNDVPAF